MGLRIAMVAACPFPARRGTPLRIERLSEALAQLGHEVEVVTYPMGESEASGSYLVHRAGGAGMSYGTIAPGPTPRKLLQYDPLLAAKVGRLLADKPFDVVHAHHVEGLLTAWWGRGRKPVPLVYDAHTMLGSELPSYGGGLLGRMMGGTGRWLDVQLPPLADHVVTVTPDIRERLLRAGRLTPDRVTVAMNGVELDVFARAVGREPIAPDRVIYTGTLAAYQGFDLLLKAFAKARAVRPSMRLVVAASTGFERYEELARSLGVREAILLEPDDFAVLPDRLADAAIAVMPRTVCDGIPQKLLNYMAAGKAVVSSAGSAKVLQDGHNGLVVPNDDVEAFAAALLRIAGDPDLRQRLAQAALDFVARECAWSSTAQICERVYVGLTGGRTATRSTLVPNTNNAA
jgi:glycosyltransferase involved in cell wall biosynthesis